jgi:Raf kinase inhibitor-like YbhB/YbcL family protein
MTIPVSNAKRFWAALLFSFFVMAVFADQKNNFRIRIVGLQTGGQIPNAFVSNQFPCKGSNQSPEISWSDAPTGTKSFAVAVLDSDAPKRGGFYHWMILNIPNSAHSLPAGTGNIEKGLTPSGAVQLKNDYGDPGYGGPCPPGNRVHHYHFLVYALRVEQLPVDQRTAPGSAASQLQNEILAKAEVVGTYGR